MAAAVIQKVYRNYQQRHMNMFENIADAIIEEVVLSACVQLAIENYNFLTLNEESHIKLEREIETSAISIIDELSSDECIDVVKFCIQQLTRNYIESRLNELTEIFNIYSNHCSYKGLLVLNRSIILIPYHLILLQRLCTFFVMKFSKNF